MADTTLVLSVRSFLFVLCRRVFAVYLIGDFPSIITVKPQKLHTHTHTHTLINEKAKGRLNPKDDENLLKIMQSEIMGIQQSQ